jgi:hypothetical protein
VITADGELQASQKLAQAAQVMTQHPAALELRLLETVVEVAAEKNSTLVLPFPVELLRFLERVTPPKSAMPGEAAATPPEPATVSNGVDSQLAAVQVRDDERDLQADNGRHSSTTV